MTRESIHFVTGRLAEHALSSVVAPLAAEASFDYTIGVLPISVAALMTPQWIARHLRVPEGTDRVIIPGYCQGDLSAVDAVAGVTVERGPRDLLELPEFFGRDRTIPSDYGSYDIEIIAEINHAPRLKLQDILDQARILSADGADVIDVGCDPGFAWAGVAECVRALREQGHRVSIDSFNPNEIDPAVKAGAELILSVNSSNRHAARDWGCAVVAVPDDFVTLAGLDQTVETLATHGVPTWIDPVLEPIGIGLAASLNRYMKVRDRYPDAEIMMGIGNLTELTEVDSAGINVLLLGICQELRIRSVLTTQVINWARSSVRECDRARRVVRYAVSKGVTPKHIEPGLVMLRDGQLYPQGEERLHRLAESIKDKNYRLFAEAGQLHVMAGGIHLQGPNPFVLLEKLLATDPSNLDASHAFYLGYELCKAATALTLGKQYRQDESLDWGLLTVPEENRRRNEAARDIP